MDRLLSFDRNTLALQMAQAALEQVRGRRELLQNYEVGKSPDDPHVHVKQWIEVVGSLRNGTKFRCECMLSGKPKNWWPEGVDVYFHGVFVGGNTYSIRVTERGEEIVATGERLDFAAIKFAFRERIRISKLNDTDKSGGELRIQVESSPSQWFVHAYPLRDLTDRELDEWVTAVRTCLKLSGFPSSSFRVWYSPLQVTFSKKWCFVPTADWLNRVVRDIELTCAFTSR